MSESPATPFFIVVSTFVCIILAYLEMVWLRKTFQFSGVIGSIAMLGVANFVFLILIILIWPTPVTLFIAPIPVIPALYVLIKWVLYYFIQRSTKTQFSAPFVTALLSIPIHVILCYSMLKPVSLLNPTRKNLAEAIQNKSNNLFSLMFALSVRESTIHRILVNEAIVSKNNYALEKLLNSGGDTNESYWLNEATLEAQLILAKWQLTNNVDIASIHNIDQLAVCYTTTELQYFIDRGLDPKTHPYLIHNVILNQQLKTSGIVTEEEMQQMKDKLVLLIDHGADANARDYMNFNPLFTIIGLDLDLTPILNLLIAKGADVNFRSENKIYSSNGELPTGLTPLMLAIQQNKINDVKTLLSHDALRDLKDDEGHSMDYYASLDTTGKEIKLLLNSSE